jgi:hypothetical protein
MIKTIQQHLLIAASIMAASLPFGLISEATNSHTDKRPMDPLKVLESSFFISASALILLTGGKAYTQHIDKQNRKQIAEKKQNEAQKILNYYAAALYEQGLYPEEYLELICNLSDPARFSFLEQTGSFDHITKEIVLPIPTPPSKASPITPKLKFLAQQEFPAFWALMHIAEVTPTIDRPHVWPHELTHALRQEPEIKPEDHNYDFFMKMALWEEVVADSSTFYNRSKSIVDDQKVNHFQLTALQIHGLNGLAHQMNASLNLTNEDKETLMNGALYAFLIENSYQSEGWINSYTNYYNTTTLTNHIPPTVGFEPPLLPPTLARLVLDVFEKIPTEEQLIVPGFWLNMTKTTHEDLCLAAEQTQWPTFKSDILAEQERQTQAVVTQYQTERS